LALQKFEEHFNTFMGLSPDQWKAPMYSVSMTTRLGLAAVVGTIAIVILAHSKDQVSTPKQCKDENCAVSTTDQIIGKKAPKSTQASNVSVDGQMILRKRNKSVQGVMVEGSADKPVSDKPVSKKSAPRLIKKPPQRLAEKSQYALVDPQRLVEKSAQPLVENRNTRRLRRADDPFLESFN
jgi:hypothetical protein